MVAAVPTIGALSAARLLLCECMAHKPKSLACNNKTTCLRSASASNRRPPHFAAKPTSVDRTDDDPRRQTFLVFARLVCRYLRLCDLGVISAMIEDISQDHPDRVRIVIALNAGQCADCGAHGFDYKPRIGISRNVFCKACDQGFNVTPDPPKVYFV